MKDLKSLVQELSETKKRAATDLEVVPYQTRSSLTNMVREAQDLLVQLREEYVRRVRANSICLFLFGEAERIKAFVTVAAEEAGVISVDAAPLYQRLAARVEGSLGANREFGPTQLQGLMEALRDTFADLGIRDMKMPGLRDLSVVLDHTAVVSQVRRLVRSAVDDELLRIYVDRKVNDAAVDQLFAGSTLPVAILGLETSEVASLVSLFSNSVSVEVGTSEDGEVDKEYVLKKLASFRKKFKSKTKNETAE